MGMVNIQLDYWNENPKESKKVKSLLVAVRGGKKSPNPLAHQNPLINCPPIPTYLINGLIDVNPIRPN